MSDNAGNQQAETAITTTADAVDKTKTTETPTIESLQASVAKLEKAVKDANKESEARRLKLEAIDAQEAEKQKAALSETDKLKLEKQQAEEKATEAVQKANERLIKAEVKLNASNFVDADAAYLLMDKSKITVDENGDVKGVVEALAELAAAKPGLLKGKINPALKTDSTNPGGGSQVTETREQKIERLKGTNSQFFNADPKNGIVWPMGQE
jgi:chromosome segregation ATPase